jgi:hypothetical protein
LNHIQPLSHQLCHAPAADEEQLRRLGTSLQQASAARDDLSAKLESERQAFQSTLQSFNARQNEILWKNKVLKLRAEVEQARRERDGLRRVLDSHGIAV